MSELSSRADVRRVDVISCTLSNDRLIDGLANIPLILARIESSLGNIFSTEGTIAPTFPSMPELAFPGITPPGCTNFPVFFPSTRFIFTFPIKSLTISAELPSGTRMFLSKSIDTKISRSCV